MVGIGEQHLCADIAELLWEQAFDSGESANGHKGGGLQRAVRSHPDAGAAGGAAVNGVQLEGERLHEGERRRPGQR